MHMLDICTTKAIESSTPPINPKPLEDTASREQEREENYDHFPTTVIDYQKHHFVSTAANH